MPRIIIMVKGCNSLEAILYYFKHREKLKNPRTLARYWLTKGTEKPYEKNIIQSIDSILNGIVVAPNLTTHPADPLFIPLEGDVLQHNRMKEADTWRIEDGKIVYHEDVNEVVKREEVV